MPSSTETLRDRLTRYRQIKISVIGRKSGKTISILVWFVLEGEKLYLLPVQGSETRWYQHLLHNPWIRIEARGEEAEFRAVPVTGAEAVLIGGREISGEVRREGREEVLFEIRCGGCDWTGFVGVAIGYSPSLLFAEWTRWAAGASGC